MFTVKDRLFHPLGGGPRRFAILFTALLPGACGLGPGDPNADPPLPAAKTSQTAIEDLALRKPYPRYPARSLENGATGVAVASIRLGPDGRMDQVDVLEAPDADIADALRDALEHWTLPRALFEEHPRGLHKLSATMVFYFLIEAGEGRVVSGPFLAAERAAGQAAAGALRRIDEAELESLLETGGAVVVDFRDRERYARGHRDGAVNLPLPELWTRAALELPSAEVVIVDCYRGSWAWQGRCDIAGETLRDLGVPDVAVVVHD